MSLREAISIVDDAKRKAWAQYTEAAELYLTLRQQLGPVPNCHSCWNPILLRDPDRARFCSRTCFQREYMRARRRK